MKRYQSNNYGGEEFLDRDKGIDFDPNATIGQRVHINDDGTVEAFGFKLKVGRELAYIAQPAIDGALSIFTQYGGAYGQRYGANVASKLNMGTSNIQRMAAAGGFLARYGVHIADIGLSGGRMAKAHISNVNQIRRGLKPYLEATHHTLMGAGRMVQQELDREKLAFTDDIAVTAIRAGTKLPAIFIASQQGHLDDIKDPSRIIDQLPPNATQSEKDAAAKKVIDLMALQTPTSASTHGAREQRHGKIESGYSAYLEKKQGEQPGAHVLSVDQWADIYAREPSSQRSHTSTNNIVDRFLHPKNQADFETNLELAENKAPAVTSFLGRLASNSLREHRKTKDLKPGEDSALCQSIDLIKEMEKSNLSTDSIARRIEEITERFFLGEGIERHIDSAQLSTVSHAIAEAITEKKLEPHGIINLIEEGKVIGFRNKEFVIASEDEVKDTIKEVHRRYMANVKVKDYYSRFLFNEDDVKNNFPNMSEDTKALLVLAIDPAMLERANVPASQIEELYQIPREEILSKMVKTMQRIGNATLADLEKVGVPSKHAPAALKQVKAIVADFNKAMERGGEDAASDYVARREAEVREVLLNARATEMPWVNRVAPDAGGSNLHTSATGKVAMKPFEPDPSFVSSDTNGPERHAHHLKRKHHKDISPDTSVQTRG